MYNSDMDKLRPYQIIALQFQISNESAKYFLGGVQKSFKKEKPPHRLILECLEQQPYEFLPTPYEIAAVMQESGLWPYELKAEPPALMDEEDLYF
jgi:hypothetical protein